jgi:hypothetical protein
VESLSGILKRREAVTGYYSLKPQDQREVVQHEKQFMGSHLDCPQFYGFYDGLQSAAHV